MTDSEFLRSVARSIDGMQYDIPRDVGERMQMIADDLAEDHARIRMAHHHQMVRLVRWTTRHVLGELGKTLADLPTAESDDIYRRMLTDFRKQSSPAGEACDG